MKSTHARPLNLSMCVDNSSDIKKTKKYGSRRKNPEYGRHGISRPIRKVAPIPKRTETNRLGQKKLQQPQSPILSSKDPGTQKITKGKKVMKSKNQNMSRGRGLFTYYVSQNLEFLDPPFPLVSQKAEIGLPSTKNKNQEKNA